AQQPRLMLADEPVASLDPATSQRVLSQLKRIGIEDGITTVVSLHQVELARDYADRVIGLAHGRVVFDGAPAHLNDSVLQMIYDQPASPAAAAAEMETAAAPAVSYNLATIED
ncbi:MAG TPA: phosphonate ABC transporter ATP-binding protein, partial [Thiobacillus sp.]|nr:phosphonate ABC transporter ATP-binding protein [Thiobacillus sp.]